MKAAVYKFLIIVGILLVLLSGILWKLNFPTDLGIIIAINGAVIGNIGIAIKYFLFFGKKIFNLKSFFIITAIFVVVVETLLIFSLKYPVYGYTLWLIIYGINFIYDLIFIIGNIDIDKL